MAEKPKQNKLENKNNPNLKNKKETYRPFSSEDSSIKKKIDGGGKKRKPFSVTVFNVDKFRSFLNKSTNKNDETIKKDSKKDGEKNIDFILEEYSGALKVKILKKVHFLFSIVILLLIAVFIFRIILDYRKIEIKEASAELANKNEQLKIEVRNSLGYKNDSREMNNKFKKIDKLINGHIYWSNLFDFLEENTLENVYYVNFESSGTEQITLQARTVSFDNLSKQLEAYESTDKIREVKIDSATLVQGVDDDYVRFNIVLTFKDNFFLK
jgi:hypothetical protein